MQDDVNRIVQEQFAKDREKASIFENAKNRSKTGNLFLISCLGVPFYVAAVIQFLTGYNFINWNLFQLFDCPISIIGISRFSNQQMFRFSETYFLNRFNSIYCIYGSLGKHAFTSQCFLKFWRNK